jgi:hypothetical protein
MKYIPLVLALCITPALAHDKGKPSTPPPVVVPTPVVEASSAPAEPVDPWHGEDKWAHGIAGLLVSQIVTVQTKDWKVGFAVSSGAMLGKEIIDSQKTNGFFSGKDLAWGVVGAAIGAYTGNWIIDYNNSTTTISYNKRF